jgi:putative selenium metabolism hydrolase
MNLEREVVDFLQDLVRAPGLAGDLKAVGEVTLQKMRALGFDDVWRDEVGNVIGRRVGSKPGPKLLFDAHMDTVEAGDRDAWVHDPFGGEASDGRLWGRGSTDDKGSLAAFMVALATLDKNSFSGEVYAVGTVGEELLEGAALESVLDAVQPDGVVIGEPTDCRLGIGHKGRSRVIFSIRGKSAHSSSPEVGENAIDNAMEVIRRVRQVSPVEDSLLGTSVMEPIQISSSPMPSFSTIPYACQVIFDRRMVRSETRENVLQIHREALLGLKGLSVDYDELSFDSYTGANIARKDFHPAWAIEPESRWVQLGLAGLRKAGIEPITYGTPYCTNGSGSAGERGIPTIIFGPGSVHVAHITDEYIEIPELVRSVHGFMGIAQSLSQTEVSH